MLIINAALIFRINYKSLMPLHKYMCFKNTCWIKYEKSYVKLTFQWNFTTWYIKILILMCSWYTIRDVKQTYA